MLVRKERRDGNETSNLVPGSSLLNRRQFLTGGASLLAVNASVALSGVRGEERSEPIDPMRVPGALPRPYGERSSFEKQTRLVASTSSTTPLQDLQGIITPSDLHFERHHNGVPMINPARHRLLIHGLVDRPTIFTIEELMRFPSASRRAFMECSRNSRDGWDKERDTTVQALHGLTSTSEWIGVKLLTLMCWSAATEACEPRSLSKPSAAIGPTRRRYMTISVVQCPSTRLSH
jgi:sulfane dehydrogenase subunit SoxC